MATKKYVSFEKLGLYDEKIKAKIAADDASTLAAAKEFASGLASNYDAAGSAATVQGNLDKEIARAQAAEAAALKAGQDAQGEVDALESVVGTLPAGETSVIDYIEKKTAGIASDAALTELAGKVTQAEKDIDAIEADYLKAADKEAVEALITAEAETARAAEKANADAIDAIEADYLKAADKAELAGDIEAAQKAADDVQAEMDAFKLAADVSQDAVDTLKEIQDYITTDGQAAAKMTEDIAANKSAVEAVEGRMDTAEGAIEAVEGRMDTAEGAIEDLQALFGEGDGTVADMIAEAVAAEKTEREAGDAAAEASAAAALKAAQDAQDAADAAQDAADAAQGEVDALEGVVAGKAAASDLTALTGRVTTAEGKITTLEGQMTAVEALAAANKVAHEANAAAIALKASQADLEAEVSRATGAEQALGARIDEFVEVSAEEINGLFPTA